MYMLFASGYTFGKMALDYAQPVFFIGIRMTTAGLLLLGYQYFFNRIQWQFGLKHIMWYWRVSVFRIFIPYAAQFWALSYVTTGKAALLQSFAPFITALFAYYMFAERLSLKKWLGLVTGFIGFIPVLITQVSSEDLAGYSGVISMPEIMLLVSVTAACYGWIISKQMVVDLEYSPIMLNGISVLGGGVLALIASLLFEQRPLTFLSTPTSTTFVQSPLFHLVLLTSILIMITIIGYNIYGALLKRYSVTFLSFAGFTTPLFAALFGWFLRGETISWYFVASVLIIFCGLCLFYSDELRQERKRIWQ